MTAASSAFGCKSSENIQMTEGQMREQRLKASSMGTPILRTTGSLAKWLQPPMRKLPERKRPKRANERGSTQPSRPC